MQNINQKIKDLAPSEVMAIVTLLLIVIGGTNLYSYHHYLGINFLFDEITIAQLIISTFKSLLGVLFIGVISWILYALGIFIVWVIGLFFTNFQQRATHLWSLFALLPALSCYWIFDILFNIQISLIVVMLVNSIAMALVFKKINNRFSHDDIIIFFYIFLAFFSFGVLEAKIDLNSRFSLLPKIQMDEKHKKADWRILKRVNEQILIINLNNLEKREYKMIKIDDVEFYSKKRAE